MKFYSAFTKQAGKLLAKAERVFCVPDQEENYFLITDGYAVFRIHKKEYDEFILPALKREAGAFSIQKKEYSAGCTLNLTDIWNKAKAQQTETVNHTRLKFTLSNGKTADSFLSASGKFTAIANSAFIESFDLERVSFSSAGSSEMIHVFDNVELERGEIALVLPIRNDAPIDRAIKAYYTETPEPMQSDREAKALQENAELKSAYAEAVDKNITLETQLEEALARIAQFESAVSAEVDNEDLANALADVSEERDRAIADLSNAEQENESLKATISHLENVLEAMEKDLEQANNAADAYRNEQSREDADLKSRKELALKVSILEYRLNQLKPETKEQKITRLCNEVSSLGFNWHVNGEKTALPIIWIAATKADENRLASIGAKYAAKRDAYYIPVA